MRPSHRLCMRAMLTPPAILCGGLGLSMCYPAFLLDSGVSTTRGFMTLFGASRRQKNEPLLTGSAIQGSVTVLNFLYATSLPRAARGIRPGLTEGARRRDIA